jgi:hypothetical protein
LASAKTKTAPAERIDTEHRRYRIIGGKRAGAGHAIAYLGMRKIEERSAESTDAAIAALREVLDLRVEKLQADRVEGVPSEAEYDEALQVLQAELPEQTMAVLAFLSRLPEGAATVPEIAFRLERSESAVATGATRIGKKLGALLDFAPDTEGVERAMMPLLTFAKVETRREKAPALIRLRPEILATLRANDRGDSFLR